MKTLIGLAFVIFSGTQALAFAQSSELVVDLASGKTNYKTVKGFHQLTFVDLKTNLNGEISPISFSEIYKDQTGLSCRVHGRFSSNQAALKYFEGSKLNWQVNKAYDNGVIPPYQFIAKAQMKEGLVLKLTPSSLQYSKSLSKSCLEWQDNGMYCDDLGCHTNQKCVSFSEAHIKTESISFALGLGGKNDLNIDCDRVVDILKTPNIPDMQLNDMNLLSPVVQISVE